MRLLFISNLYPPHLLGGYELLCGQVAERAAATGHAVTVLTSTYGASTSRERRGGVEVQRRLALAPPFPAPPIHSRRHALPIGTANGRLVSETVATVRPDAIALWSQLRLTAGPARAALATGRPCSWVLNDLNLLSLAPRAFTARLPGLGRAVLDRTLHRRATLAGLSFPRATAISRLVRDQLAAGGLPVGHASIIYQGIPVERFPMRPEAGLLHQPPRLLYVGALLEQKGVHTLAEAAADLARRGVRFELDLVGEGDPPYVEGLRQRLAGVPGVRFLGRIPNEQLSPVYQDHDLLVFPSLYREGFGLTFLEAMASGLPVVASDVGGHTECLVHEANAVVFPAGNAVALADALHRLIRDGDLRLRLARSGRVLVERRFTLERYADALLRFVAAS